MSSSAPFILTPTIRPSPSLISFDSPSLRPTSLSLLDIDTYENLSLEFIDRLLSDDYNRSPVVEPAPSPPSVPVTESILNPFANTFLLDTVQPVQSTLPKPTQLSHVLAGLANTNRSDSDIHRGRPLSSRIAQRQSLKQTRTRTYARTQKAIRPDRGRSASPHRRAALPLSYQTHHPASSSHNARASTTTPPLVDVDCTYANQSSLKPAVNQVYRQSLTPESPPSRTSSISSTPDLTPDTSFSSNARGTAYIHGSNDDIVTWSTSILLSDPVEIAGLFRLDIQPLPYPTEALVSKPELKPLPPKVEAALIDFSNETNDGDCLKPITSEEGRQIELQDFRQVADPFGEPLQNDFGLDLDPEEYEDDAAAPDTLVDLSSSTDSVGGSTSSWLSPAEYQTVIESALAKVKRTYHSPKPRRTGEEGYDVMSLLDSTSTNGNGPSHGRDATRSSMDSADAEPAIHTISPYSLLLANPSPRLTVPPEILDPPTPDTLQSGIMSSWMKTEPSKESRVYKKEFLKSLTRLVNGRFGNLKMPDGSARFKVDVFGSVSWGGETGKSGDMDLVILDRALPQGYHPSLWRQPPDTPSLPSNGNARRNVPTPIQGLPQVYHTYALATCLRNAGMQEVQPIPGASTPIVKFKATGSEALECDINANDLGGWYNSLLILHYCLISPYLLRPLIHVLKLWASAHNLNDASGSKGPATMSSYCLTLMAIAYLQHRGCLPNLQAEINVPPISRPADEDPDVVWVSWSKDQGVPAHVAFARSPPVGWKSAEPDLTVADALRGFFAFFSTTPAGSAQGGEKKRFNHRTEIISIIQGGIAKRVRAVGAEKVEEDQLRAQMQRDGFKLDEIQAVMTHLREKRIEEEERMGKGDRGIQPRNWSERRLVVQDPFLWAKNCAGMISKSGLDRWFDCVDKANRLFRFRGSEATIEELLYNPMPVTPGTPQRGRGRGRGTPSPVGAGMRGSLIGRGGPRW